MRLPAEWEPQAFVQIAWPHAETDWAPYLKAAWECYGNIAREIARREPLAIITPEPAAVRDYLRSLANVPLENIRLIERSGKENGIIVAELKHEPGFVKLNGNYKEILSGRTLSGNVEIKPHEVLVLKKD